MRWKTEPACSRFVPVYPCFDSWRPYRSTMFTFQLQTFLFIPPKLDALLRTYVSTLDFPKPGSCMNLDEPGIILQNMFFLGKSNPVTLPETNNEFTPEKWWQKEASLSFLGFGPFLWFVFCCLVLGRRTMEVNFCCFFFRNFVTVFFCNFQGNQGRPLVMFVVSFTQLSDQSPCYIFAVYRE